jgi:hypothetical protein
VCQQACISRSETGIRCIAGTSESWVRALTEDTGPPGIWTGEPATHCGTWGNSPGESTTTVSRPQGTCASLVVVPDPAECSPVPARTRSFARTETAACTADLPDPQPDDHSLARGRNRAPAEPARRCYERLCKRRETSGRRARRVHGCPAPTRPSGLSIALRSTSCLHLPRWHFQNMPARSLVLPRQSSLNRAGGVAQDTKGTREQTPPDERRISAGHPGMTHKSRDCSWLQDTPGRKRTG